MREIAQMQKEKEENITFVGAKVKFGRVKYVSFEDFLVSHYSQIALTGILTRFIMVNLIGLTDWSLREIK